MNLDKLKTNKPFLLILSIFFISIFSTTAQTFTETFGTGNFSEVITDGFNTPINDINVSVYRDHGQYVDYMGFDNPFYFVSMGGGNGQVQNISDLKINTPSGLKLQPNGAGSCVTSNCRSDLAFEISDVYRITNLSTLSFSCSGIDSSTTNDAHYLFFTGKEDELGFGFSLSLNDAPGNDCSRARAPSNCCEQWISDLGNPCDSATSVDISTTFEQIQSSCNINTSQMKDLEFFSLVSLTLQGTQANYYIDDISFTYINDTNTLPTGNFTVDSYVCINQSQTSITIPLNISFIDDQEDTILYSTRFQNYLSDLVTVDFGDKFGFVYSRPELLYNYKDLSGNACEIYEQVSFTETTLIKEENFYSVNDMYLAFRDSCTGSDKKAYYELDQSYKLLVSLFDFKDISQNETLEIIYHSQDLQENLNIKLNHTSYGNITLHSKVNDIYQYIGEQPYYDDYRIELIPDDTQTNSIKIIIQNTSSPNIIDYTFTSVTINKDLNEESTSYITIDYTDSTILLNQFFYRGFFITPTFLSTKPTEKILYGKGVHEIELYVTDSRADSGDYTKHTQTVLVTDDSLYCEVFSTIEDVDKLGKQLKKHSGKYLERFLKRIGMYERGKYFLFVFFWFLVSLQIINDYSKSGNFNITNNLIFNGVISSIIAFMAGYTAVLITFLVMIAFLLAVTMSVEWFSVSRR